MGRKFGTFCRSYFAQREVRWKRGLNRIGPLLRSGWSPLTIIYRSLMMLCYPEARCAGKCLGNPARAVLHRREDNSRVRFLKDAEEKKFRQVIQTSWPSHLPEFELGLSTGLRKGSQYALTWEMVDWEGRMLNIPTSKKRGAVAHSVERGSLGCLETGPPTFGDGTGRVFQSAKTGNPLENGWH